MIIKLLIIALAGILCGLLGAYAGANKTSTNWRKIGIPIVLTTIAYLILRHLGSLSLLLLYIPLSRGYGIPCWNDKGSLIGRFFYNLFGKYADFLSEIETQKFASILTRGTIGKLVCLTAISIPIITGNWLVYFVRSAIIIGVYAGISWRGWGNFKFLGKTLTHAEFLTYFIVGACIIAMVVNLL